MSGKILNTEFDSDGVLTVEYSHDNVTFGTPVIRINILSWDPGLWSREISTGQNLTESFSDVPYEEGDEIDIELYIWYQNRVGLSQDSVRLTVEFPEEEESGPVNYGGRPPCGPNDIELFFEESGVRVIPFEVDSFERRDRFDYARVRVTVEAGEHIIENAIPTEPVQILSEGITIARYYLPDDSNAVSVTQETGDSVRNNGAFIRLYDELRMLERATVNKSYSGYWLLEDVIDDLYSRVERVDNYGVINGWEPSNVDISYEETYTIAGQPVLNIPAFGIVVEAAARSIEGRGWLKSDANFDFQDVTVWEAMKYIVDHYGMDIFVDNDSVLRIGKQEFDSDIFPCGFTPNMNRLVGFSVPTQSQRIQELLVNGAAKHRSEQNDWEMSKNDNQIHAQAIAVRTDIDEGRRMVHDARGTDKGEELEEIARRKMDQVVKQTSNGSATIDVLSSSNPENVSPNPKKLTIGDRIFVPDYPNCIREINSAFYEVNGIHHQISNRVGWNMILDISEIVASDVQTKSYFFDPTSEEFMFEAEHQSSRLSFIPGID